MPFLSSIAAFFSPSTDHGGSGSGSKRATINSTFDAFSLPTTSHGGLGNPLRDVVSLEPSLSLLQADSLAIRFRQCNGITGPK